MYQGVHRFSLDPPPPFPYVPISDCLDCPEKVHKDLGRARPPLLMHGSHSPEIEHKNLARGRSISPPSAGFKDCLSIS